MGTSYQFILTLVRLAFKYFCIQRIIEGELMRYDHIQIHIKSHDLINLVVELLQLLVEGSFLLRNVPRHLDLDGDYMVPLQVRIHPVEALLLQLDLFSVLHSPLHLDSLPLVVYGLHPQLASQHRIDR